MMVKTIFVTYLIALLVCLTCAYRQECAVGPAYWCQSFQNAQDCGAVKHCTDTVWIHDEQHQYVDSSTKCDWCEKIMENTHHAIENIETNSDLIQSTLSHACGLLPLEDISTKCTDTIQKYQTTVLSLMTNHRYNRLCRLMNICSNENSQEIVEDENKKDDSKMLCNVLVRATQELQTKQEKTREEIQNYLKNDCQTLKSSQLVEKCEDLVERHGTQIYAHVASHIESSRICDYLDNTALQVQPKVHCELCTFVLSMAKQMLHSEHTTEDEVLRYVDEQVCSRLVGQKQKNCRQMIDKNGRELLKNIQQGMQPTLLCTHLQFCVNDIVQTIIPVEKTEMANFLTNDLCSKLGKYQSACEAAIGKETTELLQILINEMNGKDLCELIGLCPKQSAVLDKDNLGDDPSKCKRCVRDFTRRKHIAERLVNRSSEFLHHLCGQLPQQDECVKSVDQSISELVTFIQSLDPRGICVQLNMCDQHSLNTLQSNEIIPSENTLQEEILLYIKTDICPKHGSLASLCEQFMDSEGSNLLNLLTQNLDPHRICHILDICPGNTIFQHCHDHCQCCTNKMEIYQRKLENLLKAMVASTRIMCDHVPGREMCLRLADHFQSNVEKIFQNYNAKSACQLLEFCPSEQSSSSSSSNHQCTICQSELNLRQTRFRSVLNEITNNLLPLCQNEQCRQQVQTLHQQTSTKLDQSNADNVCQRLGYCLSETNFEPSETTLRLRQLLQQQTKSLEQRLQTHQICSEYGQYQTLCEHLLISNESHRYSYVYMSLLKNNPRLFDDDLREQLQSKTNADVCTYCKNAVDSSKDFWLNTLEAARNFFLSTCKYCSAQAQCQDYTNRRFDSLKSYVNSVDAEQFCSSLHLCSTMSVVNENENLADNSNKTCVVCEYVMNMLSNYIHQQSTEQEIEQSLQQVCKQVPQILRQQCEDLVDNYGPPIIATLINDFDLSTLCRKLNLCTKQMKVEVSDLNRPDSTSCGICDYVSTYVDFTLKRDASEKSFQHALATVCSHLPSQQKSTCQTMVQLIQNDREQLQFGSGKNFCTQLTICQTQMSQLNSALPLRQPTKSNEEKEIVVNNLDETPQCMLCRYVVTYLDAILKNNKSEAAVEAALARVCTILPRKERASCTQFVKTYGPVLAELITEMADPQLICRYLGMCQVVAKQTTPVTYPNHQYVRIPV